MEVLCNTIVSRCCLVNKKHGLLFGAGELFSKRSPCRALSSPMLSILRIGTGGAWGLNWMRLNGVGLGFWLAESGRL